MRIPLVLVGVSVVGFVALGGCTTASSSLSSTSEHISKRGGLLQNFAQSYLLARAVDQAYIAGKQESNSALARAGAKLRVVDLKTLQQMVETARLDAQTLNSIGYGLADKGTGRADWERAELLTRLSMEKYDALFPNLGNSEAAKELVAYNKAQGPQDSHAWALFKLGRTGEARAEAEAVLTVLGTSSVGGSPSAEVVYHLAEIYRASGEGNKALSLYHQALNLGPDSELREKIAVALNILSGQWRQI